MGRLTSFSKLERDALLLCGVLSSMVYVVANIAGALAWREYSSKTQTVSELFAFDAPSRPTVVPLLLAYSVLLVVFGFGMWQAVREAATRDRHRLRLASLAISAIGLVGLAGPPIASIHLRGVTPTIHDTLHVILTGVISLLTLIAMGLVASTRLGGGAFRRYSIATIAVLILFGALAAADGPKIAAQLPTPWVGVTERINIGSYLLWIGALATVLLRRATGMHQRMTRTSASSLSRPKVSMMR